MLEIDTRKPFSYLPAVRIRGEEGSNCSGSTVSLSEVSVKGGSWISSSECEDKNRGSSLSLPS